MVNRTLSIWNDLRPFSVGFDNIFAHFNDTLEYTANQSQSYPPYNINKLDDLNWEIEMALAGFSKDDIEISYADNQLTIKHIKREEIRQSLPRTEPAHTAPRSIRLLKGIPYLTKGLRSREILK